MHRHESQAKIYVCSIRNFHNFYHDLLPSIQEGRKRGGFEQSTILPIILTTLTLGVTLLYFLLQPRGEENQSPREFEPYGPLGHYERCKFEYEAFSEGIRSRDYYTMITGSIIVSACALILVQSLGFAEYRV